MTPVVRGTGCLLLSNKQAGPNPFCLLRSAAGEGKKKEERKEREKRHREREGEILVW